MILGKEIRPQGGGRLGRIFSDAGSAAGFAAGYHRPVNLAASAASPCVGRFAPSPTGPLHAGSLVAALASWLDARARGGRWLLRIEDVDAPRCVAGADREILRQLTALGLLPDEPPLWQSHREALYRSALDRLIDQGQAYGCGCTRQQIAAARSALGPPPERHAELVYPGTCRPVQGGTPAEGASRRPPPTVAVQDIPTHPPRAWRLKVPEGLTSRIEWNDRRLGPQTQDVAQDVGDFVLQRADGVWAYQLAVVADDAAQGVTDVVRGEDLANNTPRQILLQRALSLPTPRYLHTPLVRTADGEKLSKQHGAPALAVDEPLAALRAAAQALGLTVEGTGSPADWRAAAVEAWRDAWITRKE